MDAKIAGVQESIRRAADQLAQKKIDRNMEAKRDRNEMQLKKSQQVKRDRVEMSKKAQELFKKRFKENH